MTPKAERKRSACPADLNRFITRSLNLVGWFKLSARLFWYLSCRCSTLGIVSALAAL